MKVCVCAHPFLAESRPGCGAGRSADDGLLATAHDYGLFTSNSLGHQLRNGVVSAQEDDESQQSVDPNARRGRHPLRGRRQSANIRGGAVTTQDEYKNVAVRLGKKSSTSSLVQAGSDILRRSFRSLLHVGARSTAALLVKRIGAGRPERRQRVVHRLICGSIFNKAESSWVTGRMRRVSGNISNSSSRLTIAIGSSARMGFWCPRSTATGRRNLA